MLYSLSDTKKEDVIELIITAGARVVSIGTVGRA